MLAGALAPQSSLQLPQFAGSVKRSISQPSLTCPLQSKKPPLQAYWQAPSEHPVDTMFAGAPDAQSLPQAPQLTGSLSVSVSQPSRSSSSSALQSE
jgi:hypothetical protein